MGMGAPNQFEKMAVDAKTDIDNNITPSASGKGPTNPVTGQRESDKKGVESPFGQAKDRRSQEQLDFNAGFDSNAVNPSSGFAQAQDSLSGVLVNDLPSEGASNKLFQDVELLDEPVSDATLAAASMGAGGDDKQSISQLK
jgi:hypothetical protein